MKSSSSGGFLPSMLRAFVGTAPSEPNEELCKVLDEEAHTGDANGDSETASREEEHLLRVRAEAAAQDAERRLVVAQEQLAEYAAQKRLDADGLLQHAQQLEQALQGTAAGGLLQQVSALRQSLQDAAAEAAAFAEQQRQDVERLKGGQAQQAHANGVEGGTKRTREDGADDMHDMQEDMVVDDDGDDTNAAPAPPAAMQLRSAFTERARYIPLRLSMDERRLLRLLEAALSVSEYTDKVDIASWRSKSARIHAQIKDICAILSGLVVAQNYKRGQQLIVDRNFQDNAQFFEDVFEVGRRHKIMNPERMRGEYGKLMYMLMDSADPAIQELLEFKCVRPLHTVYTLLEDKGGLALLEDGLMEVATAEIVSAGRPRHEVQRDIKRKEKARAHLASKYRTSSLSEDDILRCLYSIGDNNSFLLFNRDPIDKIIAYLDKYYKANTHEPGHSLAIQAGCAGARLSHHHERQYTYVKQSLLLWREINHNMFKLWCKAEDDMLCERNPYRLINTGQGMNRVQQANNVSRTIHAIIHTCQQRLGHWVGSSVVHLGDHNVPNALMFIDKYTQVPRILGPLVLVLDELPVLAKDPQLAKYLASTFGGVEECRKAILTDFFRHGFDGSGADNFFDSGSCIDGRLTSAWNWCNKLEKKAYYPVFKLAGFAGFDGNWKG